MKWLKVPSKLSVYYDIAKHKKENKLERKETGVDLLTFMVKNGLEAIRFRINTKGTMYNNEHESLTLTTILANIKYIMGEIGCNEQHLTVKKSEKKSH